MTAATPGMVRADGQVVRARQRLAATLGAPDLRGARQEHQEVAVEALVDQLAHRCGDPSIEGLARGGEVLDRHLEVAHVAAEVGGVEEADDGRGVEGGAHGHNLQIGTGGPSQPPQQGEGQVTLQVTLVELVDDHRVDLREAGIAGEPPCEHPLGDELQPGATADLGVETHPVADRLADLLTQLGGHPRCRHARGQAAWLQHDDAATRPAIEQGARDSGGLARTGARLHHQRAVRFEAGDRLVEEPIDGQRAQLGAGHTGQGQPSVLPAR